MVGPPGESEDAGDCSGGGDIWGGDCGREGASKNAVWPDAVD